MTGSDADTRRKLTAEEVAEAVAELEPATVDELLEAIEADVSDGTVRRRLRSLLLDGVLVRRRRIVLGGGRHPWEYFLPEAGGVEA